MGTLRCCLLSALLLLLALLLPAFLKSLSTRPSVMMGPAAGGRDPAARGAGPAAQAAEPSASDAVAAGVTNAELSLVSSLTIPVSEEAPAASSVETAGAAFGGESPKLTVSALDILIFACENKPPC